MCVNILTFDPIVPLKSSMSLTLTCVFLISIIFVERVDRIIKEPAVDLWSHLVMLMLSLATFVTILMFYAVDLVKTPVRD